MRRRCLGLIRPYLDETARRLETWATCVHYTFFLATDTWRQMGSKTSLLGTYA
jgi:hypothetical protein